MQPRVSTCGPFGLAVVLVRAVRAVRAMPSKRSAKKAAKGRGIIYTRTSSKANEDGASCSRQKAVAVMASTRTGIPVVKTMMETVSGSLPLDKRNALKDIIEDHKGIKTIFVESSRAIARSAKVAEGIFELAKEHGVAIIPADVPDLYNPNPTAVQKFVRRTIFAMTELERDLVVDRLKDGRKRAVAQRQKEAKGKGKKQARTRGLVTQVGRVKLGGNSSVLQKHLFKIKGARKARIKDAIFKRKRGEFGWRVLGDKLCKEIKIEDMSHMAAKRFSTEFTRFF